MSVLTYIDGVPLYSTINEALEWAGTKGISDYHVHKYESATGYMGGKDRKQASIYPGDSPRKEKRKSVVTRPRGNRIIYFASGETHHSANSNHRPQAKQSPWPGCTDPLALNYEPLATIDDGSCIYPSGPCGGGSATDS